MTVQRYRRKPRQEDGEDQFAARYEPGKPLDDLRAVARMADDDAVLTEVGYRSGLFRNLAGPYLVVLYSRVPDERAAEVTAQLVKPGDYLAYSSGNEFLYDTDEAGWRQFYDLAPDGGGWPLMDDDHRTPWQADRDRAERTGKWPESRGPCQRETLMRRDPFTWPREECPVETASLVLHLKDGRRVEYTVSEPDAARLLCDYAPGRYPSDDDIRYGPLLIAPDPRVIEPRPPLQFTVTFGFRIMRRDEFLRVTETPAEEVTRDPRARQPGAPVAGSCQFFSFPTAEESAMLGITMDSDPNLVLDCGNPQGDGPLFFFVPVPGGAVRVAVCAKHGERLAFLYGPDGGGTNPQAQATTCPREGT